MQIAQKARDYANKVHSDTNHLYDGQPYIAHLQMVANIANKFIHLIPEHDRENVLSACYLHDTIEDCRVTFSDLSNHFCPTIVEIVYALTNEKGRSRKERANDKYYQGIRNTPYATFVKLCDRIANVQHSKDKGSSMFEKYKKENKEFSRELINVAYLEMFVYLEDILY